MASYEKDLENQNYDLMVKLANLQEILDDFNQMKEENEELYQTLLVSFIGIIKSLLRELERITIVMDMNGFDVDDIHYSSVSVSEKQITQYCEKYIEDSLKDYTFNSPQNLRDCEIIQNALKPFINKFELSGEDDESV